VDYAHKPDALEKVLQMLRSLLEHQAVPGKLITVFGCGGDRDRGKRPLMGEIAARLSDWVVLTSDNPRSEEPETILSDVLAGIPAQMRVPVDRVTLEVDRARAIETAILSAKPGDVILIAGKGHEDYQIIRDPMSKDPKKVIKVPFDDRKVAADLLFKRHNG
jgi:UDP-N-acetylmuramoyl-L-alanyl-D-glutamate--2,6-diaminopimelate ligase